MPMALPSLVENAAGLGEADVGIVPMQLPRSVVVGHLREGAEIGRDRAAVKEAGRGYVGIVVGAVMRRVAGLVGVRLREGRDDHGGNRREIGGPAPERVAVQLEEATVGRQLGKAVMADCALLAGLPRVARQRGGITRGERQPGESKNQRPIENPRPASDGPRVANLPAAHARTSVMPGRESTSHGSPPEITP